MTRQLVFVHGRSQQFKDADALKAEWIEALERGLGAGGLTLPIEPSAIRFPYYGQALFDLSTDVPDGDVAEIIVRSAGAGAGDDHERRQFFESVVREIEAAELSQDELREPLGDDLVLERGITNREWFQRLVRRLDRIPGVGGALMALVTNDVYDYLRNPGIQNVIESGVRSAVDPAVETIVVSHSLGTVVAYNLLRREGHALGWKIPLLVTLGSPLGIREIRRRLRPIGHPRCVDRWWNAFDERDFVALAPLDAANFRVDPEIENKSDVDNHTDNRHGIAGYLDDPEVARRIHDALTASPPEV